MASVSANGIRIEYETFGDRLNPAILLIMGYAAQMIAWPESFCAALADRGFFVIRFDNRDVGRSTHFDGQKTPSVARSLIASLLNIKIRTPYFLDDMADDVIGLLDALDIRTAHVVGASMGGMIAQIIASGHAERVRSLTSMMSTSGHRSLPGPKAKVLKLVLLQKKKTRDPDAIIDYMTEFWQLIGSPGFPTPTEERKRLITSWVERDCDMDATVRQFAAMAADGDRSARLQSIDRPTLVIPGEDDPLIRVECGRHTAANIAGANLQIIPGMGHDLPEQLVPRLVELVASHCSAADNLQEPVDVQAAKSA